MTTKKKNTFNNSGSATIDRAAFDCLVRDHLLPATVTGELAPLLRPEHRDPAVWTVDQAVLDELYAAHQNLLQRWMQRASLFGAHRVLGPDKVSLDAMKRARVALTEDDLDVAWTTLEMDGRK